MLYCKIYIQNSSQNFTYKIQVKIQAWREVFFFPCPYFMANGEFRVMKWMETGDAKRIGRGECDRCFLESLADESAALGFSASAKLVYPAKFS
jgi:hypothetical protein